jgi:hypothetical protein
LIDNLTQFTWGVCQEGHSWKATTHGGSEYWFLTRPIDPAFRYYAPLKEQSGLFRTFAGLPPERPEILKFADTFGLLGIGKPNTVTAEPSVRQEPMWMWLREIRAMAFADRVREMLNRKDVPGLSTVISWNGTDAVYYTSPETGRRVAIATKRGNPELLDRLRREQVILPARVMLQRLINEHLEGHVSGKLLFDPTFSRLNLYMAPENLLSALWLQLAKAVDGNKVYSQCEECRNWFEVSSPDGGRADKRFCNTACRARAWRKAKESK